MSNQLWAQIQRTSLVQEIGNPEDEVPLQGQQIVINENEPEEEEEADDY